VEEAHLEHDAGSELHLQPVRLFETETVDEEAVGLVERRREDGVPELTPR
jgi:hypothetical protein